MAFYATGSNGCDDIKLFPAKGTPSSAATTVVDAKTAHGGTGACHVNNIEYNPLTTAWSSRTWTTSASPRYRNKHAMWVLAGTNGVTSTFSGDLWSGGEHGFHIISPTDYLIFNNNSAMSMTSPAIALELTIDPAGKKSTKKWSYTSSPGSTSRCSATCNG